MAIKTDDISALIKQQIKNYSQKTVSTDIGKIVTVGDGIANIYGLQNASGIT